MVHSQHQHAYTTVPDWPFVKNGQKRSAQYLHAGHAGGRNCTVLHDATRDAPRRAVSHVVAASREWAEPDLHISYNTRKISKEIIQVLLILSEKNTIETKMLQIFIQSMKKVYIGRIFTKIPNIVLMRCVYQYH